VVVVVFIFRLKSLLTALFSLNNQTRISIKIRQTMCIIPVIGKQHTHTQKVNVNKEKKVTRILKICLFITRKLIIMRGESLFLIFANEQKKIDFYRFFFVATPQTSPNSDLVDAHTRTLSLLNLSILQFVFFFVIKEKNSQHLFLT
jgi:hypothetical protein